MSDITASNVFSTHFKLFSLTSQVLETCEPIIEVIPDAITASSFFTQSRESDDKKRYSTDFAQYILHAG